MFIQLKIFGFTLSEKIGFNSLVVHACMIKEATLWLEIILKQTYSLKSGIHPFERNVGLCPSATYFAAS